MIIRVGLVAVSAILSSAALAQPFESRPPIISIGDAIVSGFSGISTLPGSASGRSQPELSFINLNAASAKVLDIGRPGHVWDGRAIPTIAKFEVFARDTGQVFGIATDDGSSPNIYLTATSAYGLNLVARNRSGAFERRKTGGPGVGWMPGQFGLDLQGGPGTIYKVDGRSGAVSLLTNVLLDNVPNHGPGLGNLTYDAVGKQLFVSDLATGMIHRVGLDGADLEHYDHGVAGRAAVRMQPVPFDPRGRASIARAEFNTENPDTWGFAAPARRVHAVTVYQARLYYSVGTPAQIWSIGIARSGAFANDPRVELDVPGQVAQISVTDIAFSEKGAMILAERAATSGDFNFTNLVRAGEPRVLRFWPKQPNDPAPGLWTPQPEEYAVGFAGQYRNSNGGVALGYGYDRNGNLAANYCEASLWVTAQNIRHAPALRARLEPGGPLITQGLQGMPSGPVRDASNQPPWLSYNVDYDGRPDAQALGGHMGSVRIFSTPCVPPVASYGGPGFPGSPPYISGPVSTGSGGGPGPDGQCPGANCNPCPYPLNPDGSCGPTGRPIDLAIKKTGVTTPDPKSGIYTYTLTVTNNGGPFVAAPGVLTVADIIPAGMTIANPSVPGWTCNGPLTGAATLTCTFNGGLVPAGAVTTISLTGTVPGTGPFPPYTNCATVAAAGYSETDLSNNRDCITLEKLGGILVVKEVVYRPGMKVFPPQTFTVTVTCGSTVTQLTFPNMVFTSTSGPLAINGIPIGTNCHVQEDPLPPIAGVECPDGQVATWSASYNPASQTVQAGFPPPTVTVSNTYMCKPKEETGSIIVKKEASGGVAGMPFPAATFVATVTCGSSTQTINLPSNGTPVTVNNMPLGSSCSVVEAPQPALCPKPFVDVWTTYGLSIPPSAAVASPPNTITVKNVLECKNQSDGGGVIVKKEVIGPAGATVPQMLFPATVVCGSQTFNINLASDGTPQTVSGIPAGTFCTVSEGAIPNQPGLCQTPTPTPYWTVSILPPGGVTANSPPPVVTVKNEYVCGDIKPAGKLTVNKVVVAANPVYSTPPGPFPITVTCPSGITNMNLAAGGSQTVNSPMGASCSVQEGPISTAGSTCPAIFNPSWTTTYSPSTSVVVGANTTVTVTNTFYCERGGALNVTKTLENNTQANVSGLTFPATATCGSTIYPLTLSVATAAMAHNIPIGTACTVVESLPAVPSGGCAAGSAPQWGAPVYTPANVVMTAGSGVTINVRNVLNCVAVRQAPILPIVTPVGAGGCVPPKIPGAARGQCICPQGTSPRGESCVSVERPPVCGSGTMRQIDGSCACPRGTEFDGARCVRQIACRAPMIANSAGTACVCPAGTVSNGRTCVRALSCEAPARPNRAGTACVCPAGTIARGNSCIVRERPRLVCQPPARPNARGNACVCPPGFLARRASCVAPRERSGPQVVPREQRGPVIRPGDILRFIPGGNGPRRGEPRGFGRP